MSVIKTCAYFSSSALGFSLLASLSNTDKYSSCCRSEVMGIGELTSSAYFSGTSIIPASPSGRNRHGSRCAGDRFSDQPKRHAHLVFYPAKGRGREYTEWRIPQQTFLKRRDLIALCPTIKI